MSATGRPTDRQLPPSKNPSGPAVPPRAPAMLPRQRTSESHARTHTGPGLGQPCAPSANFSLLVIGDDPASALAVPDLLDARIRIRHARNLTEAARLLTDDVACVLLDLSLSVPHVEPGIGVLREVLRMAPTTAVLAVADSEADADLAAEAVRVGAQDYLFRDAIDATLLNRTMRYAVERKRADVAQRQLTESRLRAEENARLERGLLPTPLLGPAGEGGNGGDAGGTAGLRFAARYRPGRSRALLGGDFYDVIRAPDGTVHAVIGDVCGHGPDEAALGVELRIAWRALTFAGLCGDTILTTLQQVLEHERPHDEMFATLCALDIAPDGHTADLWLAGHPAPLLARPDRPGCPVEVLPFEHAGPALGLLPGMVWERAEVTLGGPGEPWSLILYTDGLIEGRVGKGTARLGQDGMIGLLGEALRTGIRGEALLDYAVTRSRELNGGELTDDVAVILLDRP